MNRILVADLLSASEPQENICLCGWLRTRRDARDFSFLEINDGSCLGNIQCLVDNGTNAADGLGNASTGASLLIRGDLVPSPGKGQKWEVRAREINLLGNADVHDFPLQKKRHSDEFLREIAHLRVRTNKYGAVFRIRSEAGFAIHDFFRKRRFLWVQTPVLTGSDCEGAGEMFRVTTLAPGKTGDDFFNRTCSLTVSGQLEAEALATALGRVYSFGPTFRAENSNTPRHAAEFWMVEPEMSFADLHDLMDLAEDLVKYVVSHVLEHCEADIDLFNKFVDKGLKERLQSILNGKFIRISYSEAIDLLKKSGADFVYKPEFGSDLQTEHERWLAENHFHMPVIVYDYPREIKAFYMRANADGRTVAAMDVLVPGIGELIGGSQREERIDVLRKKMKEAGLNPENYWWYMDLRRFGTVPHAGFGLGFERLIMMLTGITNIRDVIPFPRTPGSLEF